MKTPLLSLSLSLIRATCPTNLILLHYTSADRFFSITIFPFHSSFQSKMKQGESHYVQRVVPPPSRLKATDLLHVGSGPGYLFLHQEVKVCCLITSHMQAWFDASPYKRQRSSILTLFIVFYFRSQSVTRDCNSHLEIMSQCKYNIALNPAWRDQAKLHND